MMQERVRGSGPGSRQTRTKQLPLHEVAAMQKKEARILKAATAAKTAASSPAAASVQQRLALPSAANSGNSNGGEGGGEAGSQGQEDSVGRYDSCHPFAVLLSGVMLCLFGLADACQLYGCARKRALHVLFLHETRTSVL